MGVEAQSADIAEATDGDIAAIAAFFHDAWAAVGVGAPGWSGATDEVIAEITRPEALRQRIGGPVHRMFLAWMYDRVLGFAATRVLDADTIELSGIVIHPDAVGGGIGSRLLAAVLEATSGSRLQVSTEADNDRALGFYRHHGFVEIGRSMLDLATGPVSIVSLERTP